MILQAGRIALLAVTGIFAICAAQSREIGREQLREPAAFDRIEDTAERSRAIFTEMGRVLLHPRCLNCHPATARPTQTDLMLPHQPFVARGVAGTGLAGARCTTCHQPQNSEATGVPGQLKWALAPARMAWAGKSIDQICAALKDRRTNGGRDLAQLEEHMAHDPLVGWAWHPGGVRTPAPGTQDQFGRLAAAWVATGAACPA